MTLKVRDIMNPNVISVSSDIGLDVLANELFRHSVSGAPVVEGGEVVGTVSRSDIMRQLNIEHTYAMAAFDYYDGPIVTHSKEEEIRQLGAMVGSKMEHLTVKDIMNRSVKSVSPDAPINEAAKLLIKHKVHRLLVIDQELVGIISSMDFVRLSAEQ